MIFPSILSSQKRGYYSLNKLHPTTKPSLLLLTVFGLLALSGFLSKRATSVSELFFTTMILQVVIFILPALFYCLLRKRKLTHTSYTFAPLPLRPLFLFAAFGALVLGSMLINIGITAIAGTTEEFSNSASSTLTGITGASSAIYVIFSFCIIPAVAEEFFFRGILLSEYTEANSSAAFFLTSLAFAASHFDIYQFPAYLYSGLILAFSLRITRNLLAPILLHTAANLFNIFLLPYLWQVTLAPLGVLFALFILAGLLLIITLVFMREAEQIYMEYATDPRREKDRFSAPNTFLSTLGHGILTPPYLGAMLLALIIALLT